MGRKNKLFSYQGKRYSATELSKLPQCIVSRDVLYHRLDSGHFDVENAMKQAKKHNTLAERPISNGLMEFVAVMHLMRTNSETPRIIQSRRPR